MSKRIRKFGQASRTLSGFNPQQRSLGGDIGRFFGGQTSGFPNRPSQPYSMVTVVYACVEARALALSRMPLTISTADDQVIESGPLVQMVERPNPKMTGRQFWKATSSFLDLFGKVYWVRDDSLSGKAREWYVYSPLQIKEIRDQATGEIISYEYRPTGTYAGHVETLEPDRVHPITCPDYNKPNYLASGLSKAKVASSVIAQFYKADLANESSLDNGVEPGGAFTMKGKPSPKQIDDFREQINDRHEGVMNRRRYMLLYGGLSWEQMAANFTDMEFVELKGFARTEICATYGVPPAVLGYFENSNRAHADAADIQFWNNTVLSQGVWLAEEWTDAVIDPAAEDNSLTFRDGMKSCRTRLIERRESTTSTCKQAIRSARAFDRKYVAWFDPSGIPAVQKSRLELAKEGAVWIDKGVPLNSVIDSFDLPFEKPPWGDTYYKPIGLVDVQDDQGLPDYDDPDGSPPEDPPEDAPEENPDNEDEKAIRQAQAEADRQLKLTESQFAKLQEIWENSWSGLAYETIRKVHNHQDRLRREVLKNFDKAMPKDKSKGSDQIKQLNFVERRDTIGQVLFSLANANKSIVVRVGPLLRLAMDLGGNQSMQEAAAATGADKPDVFNLSDPDVPKAMRQREIKLKDTNKTLRNELRRTLANGIKDGDTHNQLADRIRKQFKLANNRAATIARTEVGAAVEQARQIGRKQAGVKLKSWLSSRKETQRKWHYETEVNTLNHPIANDKDFTIAQTGNTAPHPRGANVAKEDINCGCTTLARHKGDKIKTVIARYLTNEFLTYQQLAARQANTPDTPDTPDAPDTPELSETTS